MKDRVRFYQLENDILITEEEQDLKEIIPNTIDASFEKHIPVWEKEGDHLIVRIGEIPHPMEENHYIRSVIQITHDDIRVNVLKPNEEPKTIFPYVEGCHIYAYCNLHGIWKAEVK